MTKKDFELIASILLYNKPSYTARPEGYSIRVEKWRGVCESTAQILAEKYPPFQKAKFLKACGVED